MHLLLTQRREKNSSDKMLLCLFEEDKVKHDWWSSLQLDMYMSMLLKDKHWKFVNTSEEIDVYTSTNCLSIITDQFRVDNVFVRDKNHIYIINKKNLRTLKNVICSYQKMKSYSCEKKKMSILWIINFSLDTVDQEQFNYEIVIPRSLRSTRSFSIVPDWKARLREKDQTYLTSAIRHKRSPKTSFEHSNTTLYYRIQAFNRTFDLSLIEDETFLAPSFVVQHFDQNRTWLTKDIEHCFYKGYVNQNPRSTVSISLCHGLVCRKSIWKTMGKTKLDQSITRNWLELTETHDVISLLVLNHR